MVKNDIKESKYCSTDGSWLYRLLLILKSTIRYFAWEVVSNLYLNYAHFHNMNSRTLPTRISRKPHMNHVNLRRTESLSWKSEINGDSRASGWTRLEFNIAWIQTCVQFLKIFRLLIHSLMELILPLNITQHDSYGVFSKFLSEKFENSYYKNVRNSNTD